MREMSLKSGKIKLFICLSFPGNGFDFKIARVDRKTDSNVFEIKLYSSTSTLEMNE